MYFISFDTSCNSVKFSRSITSFNLESTSFFSDMGVSSFSVFAPTITSLSSFSCAKLSNCSLNSSLTLWVNITFLYLYNVFQFCYFLDKLFDHLLVAFNPFSRFVVQTSLVVNFTQIVFAFFELFCVVIFYDC